MSSVLETALNNMTALSHLASMTITADLQILKASKVDAKQAVLLKPSDICWK